MLKWIVLFSFYSLEYKNVVFTGNDFDGYLTEVLIF